MKKNNLCSLAFVLLQFLEMHLHAEILLEAGHTYSNCKVIDYHPG